LEFGQTPALPSRQDVGDYSLPSRPSMMVCEELSGQFLGPYLL
jgi:hypothetical protein